VERCKRTKKRLKNGNRGGDTRSGENWEKVIVKRRRQGGLASSGAYERKKRVPSRGKGGRELVRISEKGSNPKGVVRKPGAARRRSFFAKKAFKGPKAGLPGVRGKGSMTRKEVRPER